MPHCESATHKFIMPAFAIRQPLTKHPTAEIEVFGTDAHQSYQEQLVRLCSVDT